MSDNLSKALQFVLNQYSGSKIDTGIVLGTGLGNLVNQISVECSIPFPKIPGFSSSTVEGHEGNLIFGKIQGKSVLLMQGRLHYYEGHSMEDIVRPIRLMRLLGVKHLIVTNAAGGLNPAFERGDIMLINDHINLFPVNPLIGKNDDAVGPRFPDLSEPYHKSILEKTLEYARRKGINVHSGVYIGLSGPCLETPAEYRYLRIIGGDAVGMSTIPEVISAIHCGMTVSGISVITDLGVEGKIKKVSFAEIKSVADASEPLVTDLVKYIVSI